VVASSRASAHRSREPDGQTDGGGLKSRLGLTAREVAQVHRWSVLPPVAAAIIAGWVGALAFSVYGQYLGFTLTYVGRITLVAVTVGAMAAVSLGAAFWVRRRMTEQV
jgi:hypothetical protein